MIGKMLSVRVAADRVLEIRWDDGVTALVDLAPIISARANLFPLADRAEFARVALSADGWSLEWPAGIDFGAPQLRLWAIERARAKLDG
jgi:hypothetical protein